MKYVENEEPTIDVHYRAWNYDGPSAEIRLKTETNVCMDSSIIVYNPDYLCRECMEGRHSV